MQNYINQQFGNYRIVRQIGQGGFAAVYLGHHTYLNRDAAIKIIYAHMGASDLQAFLAEARTIASLSHPNIVHVLEFDIKNEQPFLVMDYASQGTLRQRHPPGSHLEVSTISTYVKQVAAGLYYAHTQNIVHRDVKPENMLIGVHGEILLSDFGIAVVSQSSRYQAGQEIGGTIAYMAPEQLQGKATAASDQYALAITVYEWLCGERPFKGGFAEIGSQHLFVPPPPLREKLPSISPRIEEVVLTALAKDPNRRFPTIQAFSLALDDAINNASVVIPTEIGRSFVPTQISNLPAQSAPGTSSTLQPLANPTLTPPISGVYPSMQTPPTSSFSSLPSAGSSAMYPGPSTTQGGIAPTLVAEPFQAPTKPRSPWRIVGIVFAVILVLALLLNAGLLLKNNLSGNNPQTTTVGTTQSQAHGNVPGSTPSTATTPTATPSPTPVAPGTTLYQADWTKNLNGWTGASQWKAFNNGQVGTDGSGQTSFTIWAPGSLPTTNYAVEAHIQFVRPNYPAAGTTFGPDNYELGIVLRGDGIGNGYEAGIGKAYGLLGDTLYRPNGALIVKVTNENVRNAFDFDGLAPTSAVLANKDYPIDTGWHTYRAEVTGNSIKFLLDGALIGQTTDNTYIDGVRVGLRAVFAAVNVDSFKVVAL